MMTAVINPDEMRAETGEPEVSLSEEQYRLEEKRLVRKVDWILMPILTVTLGLQVSARSLKKLLGN